MLCILCQGRLGRKEGGRNIYQKKLLNLSLPTDLLVINLSCFCPCILDAFWPPFISMRNIQKQNCCPSVLFCNPPCLIHVLKSSFIFTISPFTQWFSSRIHSHDVCALCCPLKLHSLNSHITFSKQWSSSLLNSPLSMVCCDSTVHVCYFSNWLVWYICYFKIKWLTQMSINSCFWGITYLCIFSSTYTM